MRNNHETSTSSAAEEMTEEERERVQRGLSQAAQRMNGAIHPPENQRNEDLEPDIIDPSITGDFPLPESGPLIVGLVNQDADMRNKARFYGENRLGEELNAHRGIRKILDNIWKGGIARSYYRQKYYNEARHDILEAQSLVLEANDKERNRYNRDISKTFISDAEGIIDTSRGDSRESLLARHPEIHSRVQDIVSRYADGTITDIEDAKRQFSEVIANLEEHGRKYGEGHLSSSNLSDVAIAARQRYEDMMTVAEAMNGRLEHDDAMARVMAGFDVIYGQRQMDCLMPKYNRVDKLIDKLESSKIGAAVSPETIALAAGAAACVGEMFGKRLTSSMLMTIPGLSGAIYAGARAGKDFEQERTRAMYDVRYGREYDPEQKRRRDVMSTVYEHHNAKEVYQGLESRINAIRAAQGAGQDVTQLRQELFQATAECKYYLETDKTERSVIAYTNEIDAPIEQLRMYEWLNEAKKCLTDAGMHDVDGQLVGTSNIMRGVAEQVNDTIHESDNAARKVKVARIAKSAGFAFVSGAAMGFAIQEIKAVFDPTTQGLFEADNGDYTQRLTAGRKFANLFSGKDGFKANANMELATGAITNNSQEVEFVRQNDGTYALMRDGKQIASGIDWNADTGQMTQASIDKLHAQGIEISQSGNVQQTIFTNVQSTRTRQVSIDDFYKTHPGETTRVSRAFWYDNDTPGAFDRNELGCDYYTDPATGAYGFVTRMTDSGSFHNGTTADFSSLARGGSIKLMISPTQNTQMNPIEVTGKLLPNGQLAFVPEPGSSASAFFDANGHFTGRFAEVVQDLGVDSSGKTIIAPLATAVGNGYSGTIPITESFTETIEQSIDVPEYLVSSAAQAVEFPMLLPFNLMGAMNASRYKPDPNGPSTRREPGPHMTYGGYSGELTGESDRIGDVSPRISERKQLTLGEETAWFRGQIAEKRGAEYLATLDNDVSQSRELREMSGDVKTIVTIPVHAPSEADNIYETLSLYAQQEGVDVGSFMVVLNMNWREQERGTPEEVRQRIGATYAEIERARRDFPSLKIAMIEQAGHHGIHEVANRMNDAVMMAINQAITDGRMANDNDVVIVRNDADIKHLNKRYIASYQEAAQKNPKTPIFTGTTFFNVDRTKVAPGFGAVLTIERMNNMFGAFEGNIHTAGGNFAYRAAHFAAANGFGYASDGSFGWTGAGSDDLRVGYKIAEVFGNAYDERMENSGNPDAGDLMDPSTRLAVRVGGAVIDTDDTRYLKFYAAPGDSVINDAYRNVAGGYSTNVLRPEDIADFREMILDRQRFNGVVEQFEREMSDFITLDDGDTRRLGRILGWWFGVRDIEHICNIQEGSRRGRRQGYQFTLTDYGRERFLRSLITRMGTGMSTDARNSLQRAIEDGSWASPILHS